MTPSTRRNLVVALVALLLACVFFDLWLAYVAGCTGDPKGGVAGDPVRALEIQAYSLVPFLLALAISASIPFAFAQGSILVRSAVATLLFVLVLAGLVFAGIEIEYKAAQICFK